MPARQSHRTYLLERVDEAAVVQLYADGFEALPVQQRILIWHLYQAAIAGRDIFYDQRYAHNLDMRDVLEAILTHPSDDAAIARRDPAVHETVLDQHGSIQQPDRAKVRPEVHAGAVRGGGACGRSEGCGISAAEGRVARRRSSIG